MLNNRYLNLLGFIICSASIVIAIYLQFGKDIEPCPLCNWQRLSIILIGITFLAAALHNPKTVGRYIYATINFIFIAAGAAVAGVHLWLQHLPKDKVPSCGPSFDYLLQNYGLSEAILEVLKSPSSCATVSWTMFGISLPGWSMIILITSLTLTIATLIIKSKANS